MVNNISNEHSAVAAEHQLSHQELHQQQHNLHNQPEPLNDPSGILSNSNFANTNGTQIQIFEPIYQANVAEKYLKVASVTLPNGHKRDFHIHVSFFVIFV
jgi:hypothetical protein